ncbi:MAG: DNA translocase FtsK 4TM domain-containing protein [Tidjanibacter sp.]|nr:DNA translocase FtsK 4TM domain-containing protein [Tidjanibacter sp.]
MSAKKIATPTSKKQSPKSPAKSPSPAPEYREQAGGLDTTRWVLSFILLFISLVLLLAVISYYFTWSADQIFLRARALGESTRGFAVENAGGKMGAVIGQLLVGRMFGAFAVCVPIFLIALSLRIIRYRPIWFEKAMRVTLLAMILGSLTLGFAFGIRWNVFGTGLGGEMGIFVAEWLKEYIGKWGLALMLILGWVLWAVYVNRRTISVVNSLGAQVAGKTWQLFQFPFRRRERNEEEQDRQEEQDEQGEESVEGDEEQSNDAPEIDECPFKDEPTEEEQPSGLYISGDDDDDWRDVKPAGDEEVGIDDDVVPLGYVPPTEQQPQRRQSSGAPKGGFEIVDDGESGMVGLPTDTPGIEKLGSAAAAATVTIGGFTITGDDDDDSVVEVSEIDKNITLGAGGIVESGLDSVTVVRTELVDAEADEDSLTKLYDPTRELSRYQRPPIQILENRVSDVEFSQEEIVENKKIIQKTLENFGIGINRIKATIGPTVTLYEIEPAQGVKINRIKSLEDNIALDLKALSIRYVGLIPGKGTIGIEIPNRTRETVSFYSVVKSLKFQDSKYELPIVLGKTIQNETFVIDLAKMPHLLVAGATGQGKSVGLNVIISSLLYKKHPAELKFVMVDPKKVELSLYSKLERHFLAKMESEEDAILTDTQKVVNTLNSLCKEMEARYELLRRAQVRKISEYNDKFLQRRLPPDRHNPNGLLSHRYLPYIVVVVDEFADMIMTAGKEVEAPITRLAQLARAVGIHLIIATQRPDVKVITGLIKANFPARIAFRVTSMVDSRTIIDQPGANQLIGQGDMLMLINGELTRLQCAFLDTPEIERITDFISRQKGYPTAYQLPDYVPEGGAASMGGSEPMGEINYDPMFREIANFVVQHQQGSTSYIQRRFTIGYTRAARIMDQLESAGIVGPVDGGKPREVLVYDMNEVARILESLGL